MTKITYKIVKLLKKQKTKHDLQSSSDKDFHKNKIFLRK